MIPYSKHLKSRVVMISGDEETLRREAFEGLLREAGMAKDDFDLETFDGDSSTPLQWITSASTSPFLAERRTVVVRHLLRCEPDILKSVSLNSIPECGLLILVADDEAGSDDRQDRYKRNRNAWEKAVEKAGGSLIKPFSDPKKVRETVRARITEMGKSISEKAAEVLIEMTGGSLSRALDEVEKLVLFVGEQEQIRESDVRAVAVPSREWNVFRMVDSIVSGEVGEALRQLRILVGTTKGTEETAFRQILPMVSRALRLLWQGRVCVDAKVAPSNAPEEIRAMFPEKPNIGSETSYRQSQVMTNARRVSLARIEKAFDILSDTDARLKGALDSFNSFETLERMVLEMSDALASKPTVRTV